MKNIYHITRFRYERDIHFLCSLGNDFCNAHIVVDAELDKEFPDYIEIDSLIASFDEKKLIAEEIVAGVFAAFDDAVNPKSLLVSCLTTGGRNPAYPAYIERKQ